MNLELPPGFNDAPPDVQYELLATKPSDDLCVAIRQELEGTNQASDVPASPQLTKEEKARILLRLRDYREMVNDTNG